MHYIILHMQIVHYNCIGIKTMGTLMQDVNVTYHVHKTPDTMLIDVQELGAGGGPWPPPPPPPNIGHYVYKVCCMNLYWTHPLGSPNPVYVPTLLNC